MEINFKNVEDIIFMDRTVQAVLPWFKHLFDQYNLSFIVSGMKSLGQRSVFELLNSLDARSVEALMAHFGDTVVVSKLSDKVADSYQFEAENAGSICEYSGYKDLCITRTGDLIKASFWR